MIAKGYRAIDLDLFVAVSKYDFKETERLLELGANPVCIIKSEGDIIPYYCMDSIGTECSYLNIELQDIIIDRVQRNPMKGDSVILIYLAGLAANESMYLNNSFHVISANIRQKEDDTKIKGDTVCTAL